MFWLMHSGDTLLSGMHIWKKLKGPGRLEQNSNLNNTISIKIILPFSVKYLLTSLTSWISVVTRCLWSWFYFKSVILSLRTHVDKVTRITFRFYSRQYPGNLNSYFPCSCFCRVRDPLTTNVSDTFDCIRFINSDTFLKIIKYTFTYYRLPFSN